MRQTLIAKVENRPGVLNRVASLFRRRNFNIDSLNVGRTENPEVSRMTIVIDDQNTNPDLVEANLYKLVNVLDVENATHSSALMRELALIKVSAEPAQRPEITNIVDIYRAQVIDISATSMVIEIASRSNKIDSMLELMRPYGIIESVRTGHVAMLRGDEKGHRSVPASENSRLNGKA